MNGFTYFAYKLASLFILPLGCALVSMLVAGVLVIRGRRRMACALMVLAGSWLWFWSVPVVSDAIRGSLEAQFPFRAAADFPKADAIVLLGGGVAGAAFEGRNAPDLLAGADREWFAAQLYRAGKAPVVIVSAGQTPGQRTEPDAQGSATFLRALGVPASALVLETLSRNTLENARFVEQKLVAMGARHVLLVTSAYHMPRSVRLFAGSQASITPAASDHEVITADFTVLRLMPTANALNRSTDAIKEYLGIWGMGLQQWLQS
jgi:uncharacterized SAM-binding protein YcdF (DUF218 family)